MGLEPVNTVDPAADGAGVEILWCVPRCVEAVEVATVALAVVGVVPELVGALAVPLFGVMDCIFAVGAVRGWEPLAVVAPLVEAAEPGEPPLWPLLAAEVVEPPPWELSAWAGAEPPASAAPMPSVTAPAASQVHACR